jgi:eukaryotic-like serine/threonine-protein kinase
MTAADEQKSPGPAATPPFPSRVGSYELLLPIASGGMATVYLARKRGARGFERDVALKLTHSFLREQPEWTAQLIEEAKLAGRIHHPNVVEVLDVEDDPQGVFLVMPYVEGDTLGGLFKHALSEGAPIPTDIALRVLVDALAGLNAAHEMKDEDGQPLGLVHRDFTPQNILVGIDGVSRLADFGVAKAASRMGGTRTGVVKGKAAYMAPEQVRGQPLDRRADVWAAGVVAWELFAGKRMRLADEDQAVLLLKAVSEAPPRLRTARPDVPPAVDEAVATALTLDRARRCPTAHRFSEALVRAWSGVAAPASHAAVAAYVGATSGLAIAKRRERASAILQERAAQATESPLVASSDRPSAVVVKRSRTAPVVLGAICVVVATGAIVLKAESARRRPAASEVATTAPSAPAPARGLHLAANAPVSELKIDDSVIAFATPASELTVEVPAGVLRPGVAIEASSTDGRKASAVLGSDVANVSLSFEAAVASAAPSVPPTPPASTHKLTRALPGRPAAKGTAFPNPPAPKPSAPPTAADRPLAQSPYEPK